MSRLITRKRSYSLTNIIDRKCNECMGCDKDCVINMYCRDCQLRLLNSKNIFCQKCRKQSVSCDECGAIYEDYDLGNHYDALGEKMFTSEAFNVIIQRSPLHKDVLRDNIQKQFCLVSAKRKICPDFRDSESSSPVSKESSSSTSSASLSIAKYPVIVHNKRKCVII